MHFKALTRADMYRDGGSLEAVFDIGNGLYTALCLKAAAGTSPKFRALYWFIPERDPGQDFMNHLSRGALVEHDSQNDRLILQCLAEFLAAPVTLPSCPDERPDEMLSIVQSLYAGIPERVSNVQGA